MEDYQEHPKSTATREFCARMGYEFWIVTTPSALCQYLNGTSPQLLVP